MKSKDNNLQIGALKKSKVVVATDKKDEVTLLVSSNIFGFQFKKWASLLVENDKLYVKQPNCGASEMPLVFFHKSKEEFIAEAKRINDSYISIQKNGEPATYSINFDNPTKKPLTCTLFGLNEHLLSSNHGSSKGLIVKPTQEHISYLEVLNQSAYVPVKTKMIKIISDNYEQLSSVITIISKDANGQMASTPLITHNYITDDVKKVLPISYPVVISGNTNLSFTVQPKTKGTICFYTEKPDYSDVISKETLDVFNAVMSCQIQQGLNSVSLLNINKFISKSITQPLVHLSKLQKAGMLTVFKVNEETEFGVNFRVLTVNGEAVDVDLLTALKKSEYEINKTK